MVYSIVRSLAKVAIGIFYQKIQLSNLENIPKNQPVILAVNHPTGFMEPCILACYLDRPLYFLVRGDFFKKPLYNFLMRTLHMIPIYRAQDRGYKYLKSNYDTFKYCYDALNEKKTIMILSEGSARFEKNLRPLKKGTPRIAFGAIQAYPEIEEVFVVPIGVNYTYSEAARTKVMIDCGVPMKVRDFENEFKENASNAALDFNAELRKRLEERIVIVEKGDEELAEYVLRLDRSERPQDTIFPIIGSDKTDLLAEKQTTERVRAMPDQQKKLVLTKATAYFKELKTANITDQDLMHSQFSPVVSGLLLMLGFPIFLAGFIFNYLPVRLAKIIPDTKVTRPEFLAPVFWAVSLGAVLIWLIIWVIVLLAIGQPIWLFGLPGLMVAGFFAILYLEYFQRKRRQFRVQQMSTEKKAKLLEQRAALQAAITDKNHLTA